MGYFSNSFDFQSQSLVSADVSSSRKKDERRSHMPCRFYAAGKCATGSRCAFSHSEPESLNICKFYRAGYCKYGSSCSQVHLGSDEFAEDEEYPDMSHITSSVDQLAFDEDSNDNFPTAHAFVNPNHDHNFLPSFLVDELHLHETGHSASVGKDYNPVTFIASAKVVSSSTSEAVAGMAASSSKPSSPLPSSSFAPFSYGDAILTGVPATAASPVQSPGISLSPVAYVASLKSTEANANPVSEVKDPIEELCAFAIMGKCRYGSFCRNLHGLRCPRCLLYVLHPTDMDSNEEHLFECLSKPESVPIAQLHQILCGLCNEPVLSRIDPRFGLLNCNHPFCLSCIRAWRSTHFDAKDDDSHSCPSCSTVTYFIVPSSTWIEDLEEKTKIIDQYKKKMSLITCKYYDSGRGDCPFGNSCFYEHKSDSLENRAYNSTISRQMVEHKEQLAKVRETKLSDYIVIKSVPKKK